MSDDVNSLLLFHARRWNVGESSTADLERAAKTYASAVRETAPVRMRLLCENCGTLHIDEGEFAEKPHHTHQCARCGLCWRPAIEPTIGVRFLFEQSEKTT